MVTTSITLQDTGKRKTTSASAEETDKANSGTAITLKGVEVTLDENAILNTKPATALLTGGAATKYKRGEVDHFGVHKPKWTVRGLLGQDDATDQDTVFHLREMLRTKGYKILGGDLPSWATATSGTNTVNVRLSNATFQHKSNSNLIEYKIELYETD